MRLFAPLRSWWQALIHRSRTDREIEEELRFHIEERAHYLVSTGMRASEALRHAKIELGRADVQKEIYRAAVGLRPLHEIGSDIRYAIRTLYRYPFVSIAAVASLALGIGAASAMFNVVYSAVLNPFPYRDADRIVNPSLIDEKRPLVPTWFALEPSQYRQFVKARSIESVLGFILHAQPETGSGYSQDVGIAYVTPNMNEFLGVQPLLGRGLLPADDAGNVVLLNYKYWQQRFGGDPAVIGRTLELNHQPMTILGIMPPRFTFTQTVGDVDCYIPWTPARDPLLIPWIKLKPDVTPAAADADFEPYIERFRQESPLRFPKQFRVNVEPIATPYLHRTGRSLALLFTAVLFLLLIGCANCSVLLLARGEARQHEISIRSAIGADRFRLMRQLLVESLVVAFAGAGLGVALSLWLAKIPLKLMPNFFPQEAVITVNWQVLGFSVATALVTGVLFGLGPALRFSRPEIAQVMQSRARTFSRSGGLSLNLLIGTQIALTCILLTAAAAAFSGFHRIAAMKLGYDPHHVGFIGFPLKTDPAKNHRAYVGYIEQLADVVASVPGVTSVTISSGGIPPSQRLDGFGVPAPFEMLAEKPAELPHALIQPVSPRYFETLRIPVRQGRLWTTDENRRGDFVAVVNETFVRRYLAGREALGQQIRTDALKNDGRPATITSPESDGWRQIIAVVGDSRNDGLERPVAPAIYVPYTAFMWNYAGVFFRTSTAPESIGQPLRNALHKLNPGQVISGNEIGTLDKALSVQTIWVQQHMFSVIFTFFGGLALALSLFGITSTVLFTAGQRKNELGIRLALGAARPHIVWTVMRTLLPTITAGVMVGMILNLALRGLLGHWMPAGVQSSWAAASVALLLMLASAAASLIPAVRAALVDPMDTLRKE